jgi:chromosome segregation ATPase
MIEKKNNEENKNKLKRNNLNKKKDNHDDEVDEYKNYINKKDNKINKENETETYDPNILNTLLSQMNSLSEKQLSLIDVMDNIQMETQGQIKELNKRITKLERNIEELNNELYYIKNDN